MHICGYMHVLNMPQGWLTELYHNVTIEPMLKLLTIEKAEKSLLRFLLLYMYSNARFRSIDYVTKRV